MPSLREAYTDWKQLLSDIMMALDKEFNLAKNKRSGVTYPLKDGVKISSEVGRYIFRFKLDIEKMLDFSKSFDPDLLSINAPVWVRSSSKNSKEEIRGEILSIDGDVIILSLEEEPSTTEVDMIVDLSFLLEELKKRLEVYRDYLTPRLSWLPLSVFGYRGDLGGEIIFDEALNHRDLNEDQKRSILNASRYNVSVVCGPPGTGKSRVLACIAVEAMKKKKRVLIATHTNSALDRALKLVIEELKSSRLRFEENSIIRLGKALDLEVARFEEDTAIMSLSNELRTEYEKICKDIEYYKGMLNKWYRLELDYNISSASKTICEYIRSLEEKAKMYDVRSELEDANSKLKDISNKGLSLSDLEKLSEYVSGIQRQYTYDDAVRVILENAGFLVNFVKQGGKEGINSKIINLRSKLNEVKREMDDMRIKVRKEARLIASTLTKCMTELFKNVVEGALQKFDIALIDEVSMANLGLLWTATSITDRVVIFGDPNQIPPITLLKEKDKKLYELQSSNFFDWWGISYDKMPSNIPSTFLRKQYRMGKRICDIVSRLFYRGGLENNTTYEGAITFYDIDPAKTIDMSTPSGSRINPSSAFYTAKTVKKLIEGGDKELDIAVVTPYRDQARFIKGTLWKSGLGWVRVGTVHTFQGREVRVVVLDLVLQRREVARRSPIFGNERIFSKLLSTSMSRAIEKLIIIGSWNAFKDSNIFRKFQSLLQTTSEVKRVFHKDIYGGISSTSSIEEIQIGPVKIKPYFSTNQVYEDLRKDILGSKKYIVIVSAFIDHNFLLDLLDNVNVPITVYIKRGQERRVDFSRLPTNVCIEAKKGLHSKLVIIDDSILYFGSLNFLLPTRSEETVYRFEGRSIALYWKRRYPPKSRS